MAPRKVSKLFYANKKYCRQGTETRVPKATISVNIVTGMAYLLIKIKIAGMTGEMKLPGNTCSRELQYYWL